MFVNYLGIRAEDRRDTLVAFCTLMILVAGHAMLETARDALFLRALPAEKLPLAYLAIAVLALVVTRLNEIAAARLPRRKLLSLTLLAGGLITAGFWVLTGRSSPWVLGALYVWGGLLATVVVVQFWLQLGDVLDLTRAKRLFAVIGSGALIGALAGALLAGVLLGMLGGQARLLLLVSAGLFAGAALVPLGFRQPAASPTRRRRRRQAPTPRATTWAMLVGDRYLGRLFVLLLLGAVIATVVDYLFKAEVAQAARQGGWDLGLFFARYYAAVAAAALVMQLGIAPRLLRRVGVDRVLFILPALLLLGSIGFILTLGVLPALLLKGADGALRFSVHQTASEILFLPLGKRVRERFKGFASAVGQRGGQALASLLVLALTAWTSEPRYVGYVLLALAVAWLASLVGIRPLYLELFRKQLKEGTLETDVEVPELDLASFETLLGALSSADDTEVIAALELFDSYGKTDVVPALILYHPSRQVVLRAFDLFARTERRDVIRLTGRLLRHDDPEIRAAAVRTVALARPDEQLLRGLMEDESPAVRCTALVGLVGAGLADDAEATHTLRCMVEGRCGETRLALARALRHLPAERFAWVGLELAEVAEPGLAAEVAESVVASPDARYLPALLDMLARRDGRAAARRALVAIGDEALAMLERALGDAALPRAIRRHLPRTISRFAGQRAAPILLAALEREQDEAVTFKILRGLGRLRAADPSIFVDRLKLLELAQRTVERAVTMLHWAEVVEQGLAHQCAAPTPAVDLLRALLDEKQAQAIMRAFRLLHIIEPTEEYRIIYDGLRSPDRKAQASARELLSHLAPSPLGEGILAMVDELPAAERLDAASAFFVPPGRRRWGDAAARCERPQASLDDLRHLNALYEGILRDMLADPSPALCALVGYHAGELQMNRLRGQVAAVARTAPDVLGQVADQALDLFGLQPEQEPVGA